MARLDFISTPIEGLKLVQRKPIRDARGYFGRFYCAEELENAGLDSRIAQINQSFSTTRGTVRGMHFQMPPHAENKFVSCTRGEIFDVAIDLRKGSPTFLHWHGEVLSAENQRSLFIPQGFAHGFQTLTDDCELLYLVSAAYAPDAEGGVNAQDPRVAIDLPLPISEMSDNDRAAPLLASDYVGIDVETST